MRRSHPGLRWRRRPCRAAHYAGPAVAALTHPDDPETRAQRGARQPSAPPLTTAPPNRPGVRAVEGATGAVAAARIVNRPIAEARQANTKPNRVAPAPPPAQTPRRRHTSKKSVRAMSHPGLRWRRRPCRAAHYAGPAVAALTHPDDPETRAQRGARQPSAPPLATAPPNRPGVRAVEGAAGAAAAARIGTT